jgi:hypothetical protein
MSKLKTHTNLLTPDFLDQDSEHLLHVTKEIGRGRKNAQLLLPPRPYKGKRWQKKKKVAVNPLT